MTDLANHSFQGDIEKYENVYAKESLSAKPRSETATSFLILSICLGTIYAVISRISAYSFDIQWVLLCFLATFAWNLKDSALCFIFMQDEALYRICHKLGWHIPHMFDEPRPRYRARSLLLVLLFMLELYTLAYVVIAAADYLFPLTSLRVIPFTGGG